jgi:hypothetical protein
VWTRVSAKESIIAVMIKANGTQAFVEILCPAPRKGEKLLIDTDRMEGAYLQQLLGPPIMEFDQEFRGKAIDPKTGLVIPHADVNGCMRMNVDGPDIGIPESLDIPADVDAKLEKERFVTRNKSKIPPNPDEGNPVPVVYIYRLTDPEKYKFVETYCSEEPDIDSGEGGFKFKPIYSVPIGDPKFNGSER